MIWTGKGITFANTTTRSKGIHKTIKYIFAPTFDYDKIQDKPRNMGGLCFRAARQKGKQIDTELHRNTTKKCPETNALLLLLKNENYKIEATQVVVGDEKSRLATLVDMIVTKENKKFIVEIKYGCLYRYCGTAHGRIKHQQSYLSDCAFHQHQLQVLIGRWLYEQTFPNEKDVGVLLIYINTDTSVEIFKEDFFAVQMTPMAIQALKENGALTNKQIQKHARMSKTFFEPRTKRKRIH